jgi:hypothetical protein
MIFLIDHDSVPMKEMVLIESVYLHSKIVQIVDKIFSSHGFIMNHNQSSNVRTINIIYDNDYCEGG